MADNPFDRTNIGLRERPVSGDLNQMQAQIYRTICELARATFSGRTSNTSSAMASAPCFLHDGLRAVPSSPAAMSVAVNAGFGFNYDAADLPTNIGATDLEHVDDLAPFKPLSLLSPVSFAVPAAPGSPNSRIDIIEARTDRRLENGVTRRQLDPGTESFLDHIFFKTLAFGLDGRTGVVTNPAPSTAGLSYKIGTAGNPGLVPATTAGYTKIAEINVPNGTTSITGSNLVDKRRLAGVGGIVRASVRFQVLYSGVHPPPVSVISVSAPPGVDIGVGQLVTGNISNVNSRGCFLLYVTAGGLTRVTRTLSVERIGFSSPTAVDSVDLTMNTINQPIVVINSVFQTEAQSTGLAVGIGSSVIRFEGDSLVIYRDTSGAGSYNNAQLDNVIFNANFDIAYH